MSTFDGILVLELKWFSQAHPDGAWILVFCLQIPRCPMLWLSFWLTSTYFYFYFYEVLSCSSLSPLICGRHCQKILKPPKSHQRGPQPPSPSFPVWLQRQGHHDGKIGDEARREAPRTLGWSLCWRHISLPHPWVTRRLLKTVRSGKVSTQYSKQASILRSFLRR